MPSAFTNTLALTFHVPPIESLISSISSLAVCGSAITSFVLFELEYICSYVCFTHTRTQEFVSITSHTNAVTILLLLCSSVMNDIDRHEQVL